MAISSQDRLQLALELVNEYAFPDAMKDAMHNFEGQLHIASKLIECHKRGYDEVDTSIILPSLSDVIPNLLEEVVGAASTVMGYLPLMKGWLSHDLPPVVLSLFHRLYYHMHDALLRCLLSYYDCRRDGHIIEELMQRYHRSHKEEWRAWGAPTSSYRHVAA